MAAAMMGWQNAFHCEINPFGRAVLDYWFPESKSYEDITKTDFREWRGKIDILTGGFPCQPFSYAGKRGGADDNRYLWPQMLRAIDEIRPTWVVGENVAGLATMVEGGVLADLGHEATLFGEVDGVHRFGLRSTFTIERICRDLENHGYTVQPMLIPAAACGAPHRRDRIFILAHIADTDRRDDLRAAGEDEGTGRAQRLQERDEVRVAGEPSAVRSDGAGIDTAYANSGELQEPLQTGQSSDEPQSGGRMGDRPSRPCVFRGLADTYRERLETYRKQRGDDAKGWQSTGRPAGEPSHDAWAEGAWWDNFPTVPAVHRRNDGLSFGMDRASIPFERWRTEALKSHGNAIVPQVMYRIFQGIAAAEEAK